MLKCAIIGAGAISGAHIEGYLSQTDRCEIVGISDRSRARASEKKEKYGLETAEIFEDYREMLEKTEADLISICTPPGTHGEIAIACLGEGKHVLLEKPMATSLEECDRIMEAARLSNRHLITVAQYRYTTPFYKLHELLKSGAAGRSVHISVDALFWRGESYYDLDWRGRWATEGGGCTLNHAVHLIDQLIWHMGMPSEVAAFMSNISHHNSETEDISEAVLRWENGVMGRLTSSLIHYGEKQGIYIQTDKGSVGVPFEPLSSEPLENGFPKKNPGIEKFLKEEYERIPSLKLQGHSGQIEEMLNLIEGRIPEGIEAIADKEAGRKSLELIMAIYKAATEKKVVKLPLDREDPFYRKETMIPLMPVFFEKTRSISGFSNNEIKVGGVDFHE